MALAPVEDARDERSEARSQRMRPKACAYRLDVRIDQAHLGRHRRQVTLDVSCATFASAQAEGIPQVRAYPPDFMHHTADGQSGQLGQLRRVLIEACSVHPLRMTLWLPGAHVEIAVISTPQCRRDLFTVEIGRAHV